MKAATLEDVPAPVDLMAGFYAEAGYTLNREHAAGVRGMTVEAAPDNAPAQKVYRRLGFAESPNGSCSRSRWRPHRRKSTQIKARVKPNASLCRHFNAMTRRQFLEAAAVPAAAALLERPARAATPEYKMGIATTSFSGNFPGPGGRGRGAGPRPVADTSIFLEKCQALGAAGIQSALGGDMAKLRAKAEEYGIWIQGMSQVPRNGDMAPLEHAFANARDCGATVIRSGMLSGRRYETFPTLEAWQDWVKTSQAALKLAVPLAEKYKVTLAIENHKDWTAEQYLEIFRTYQSEYLGANYDFGNNLSFMENPMEMAEAVAPYVKSAHIKDVAVQRYPKGFLMSEIPLGRGFLDLERMMAALLKGNPNLKFSLEMMTRDPLKVPCLTDHYWAVFPGGKAVDLARTLRLVESHQSAAPLPVVDNLPRPERDKVETENVEACLRYGREHLNL